MQKYLIMFYISAAEFAELLQGGLSEALTNGKLAADEVKTLEFIYNDFLQFVNLEI